MRRLTEPTALWLALGIGLFACDGGGNRGSSGSSAAGPGTRGAAGEGKGGQGVAEGDGGSRFEPADPEDPIAQRVREHATEHFAKGMKPASRMYREHVAEGELRDYQALLKAPHCYRIVGTGGDGVRDLDLSVFDRGDNPVQQDLGPDPNPVVGMKSAICPAGPSLYRLRVKVVDGAGEIGVRVYRTVESE